MADLVAEIAVSEAKFRQQTRKVFDDALKATADFERQANDKLKDFGKGFANSEMTKAQARELDRLRKQFDPLYAASKRYEAEVQRLNRAQQIGAVNARQYNEALQRLNADFAGAPAATEEASRGLGRFGSTAQNVSFQVQDLAVQISGGTDAARALSQQLPQLLGGFGVWGAAAGAAVAVGLPLAAMWLQSAEDAGTLKERIDKLSEATDAYVEAARRAIIPTSQLRDEWEDLAGVMAGVNQQSLMVAEAMARAALRSAGSGIVKDLGIQRFADPETARYDRLARMLDITEDSARELVMSLRLIDTAVTPEQAIRSAEQLRDTLISMAGGVDQAVERFGEQFLAVDRYLENARKQAEVTRSEYQRLVDAYDNNTQEIKRLTGDREAAEAELARAVKEGNAEQVAAMERTISGIDRQIAKVQELARESDEAFQQMAKSFRAQIGPLLASGFERLFGVGPAQFGRDAEAANRGIRELIKSRESGGNYNATLDNGAYTGGQRDLVNMTINEVLAMQAEMLRHPANKKNSSAAGAYQIVGKTLRGLVDELGLTGNELYDPKMQDRLADQLLRRRRGQGIEGLRNEWEGLRSVHPAVIQTALGAESIPAMDPELLSEQTKRLREQTAERERQLKVVQDYGATLARNLVTAEQDAELTRQRADALREIEAAGLEGPAKAAAIAEVNGEYEKQRLIFALIEDAKRRQVSLDTMMTDSTMTYADAIAALGDAAKAKVIADQQQAAALDQVAQRQAFYNDLQSQMKNGLLDAIVAGESFADVLANVAQMLAKAALQAALFGEGQFAGTGGGGGLLGGLFSGIFGGARAMGGPVSAGSAYLVGEKGPEIIVPRSAGQVIPNHELGGGRNVTLHATIDLRGTTGDRALDEKIRVGAAQAVAQANRAMPSRVAAINRDPLRR